MREPEKTRTRGGESEKRKTKRERSGEKERETRDIERGENRGKLSEPKIVRDSKRWSVREKDTEN